MAHFCKNCGLLTAPYDERCPKCGAPLPHIPMGEALLESMRQSPEGTAETGEPLYEQDLEEDRIDAMSQGATTAAMLLFGKNPKHFFPRAPSPGSCWRWCGALAARRTLPAGGWPGRT